MCAWRPISDFQDGASQALVHIGMQRGWPKAVTMDNDTEFTSKALDDWAWRRGIKLNYTRPNRVVQWAVAQ